MSGATRQRPDDSLDDLRDSANKEVLLLVPPDRQTDREGWNLRGNRADGGTEALEEEGRRGLVVVHGVVEGEEVEGRLERERGRGLVG